MIFDTPILGQPRPASPPPRAPTDPILLRRTIVQDGGPRIAIDFKYEGGGTFAAEAEKNRGADMATSKWVSEVLHSHYAGHFWAVATDSHQGVCLITIPILLGNWKFLIKLNELTPAMVIKAGGEILERFRIPRSKLDVAAFCTARLQAVSRANQRPPTG